MNMNERRSSLKDFDQFQEIGKGSYGIVFKARRKLDNQVYVIKQIRGIRTMSKKEQQEALQEVQILSSLDHPNIVKYYDSFICTSGFSLNIVMEYASSGTLHDCLKRQKGQKLPENVIWKYFIQMACALYYIHSKYILHRDIKSLNVFLSGDDIKIGDFGVSKVLNHTMSMAKTMVGTPYYLSPELCENRPYGPKSDVWALGCILYELCTLKHPFDAANQGALILKIIRGKYGSIPREYSTELSSLVNEMLMRNTRSRPSIGQILSKDIVMEKSRQLHIELPRDIMGNIVPKPQISVQCDVKERGTAQERPRSSPTPPPNSEAKRISAISRQPSRKLTAAQIVRGLQPQRNKKQVIRKGPRNRRENPNVSPHTSEKRGKLSDAKKLEIEEVRNLPSTLLKPVNSVNNEKNATEIPEQDYRRCVTPKEITVSSPTIASLHSMSKSFRDKLELDSAYEKMNRTSNARDPVNIGISVQVTSCVEPDNDTSITSMFQTEESVAWKVISRSRDPIPAALVDQDCLDDDDGNSFKNPQQQNSSQARTETLVTANSSSLSNIPDPTGIIELGSESSVKINRLLDRQEKLAIEIKNLISEVQDRIGERKTTELINFYREMEDQDQEASEEHIHRFVFGRISHLDADIPQAIIKMLYLEGQLQECEVQIVQTTTTKQG